MKFEGQFTPPGMGDIHLPIPVSGPGYIQANSDHLLVSGFSSPRSYSGLIALGVVALILGGSFIFGNVIPTEIAVGILMLIIGAILGVAIKGSAKYKEDKPISLEIPWDKIKKIEANPHDSEMVLIVVKRFKPKGALYFTPQNSSKQVIEEITEFIKP